MKKLILAFMVSVALWGCGKSEPTLKGTTEQEFNQSVKAVSVNLSEAKQKEFADALATIMTKDMLSTTVSGQDKAKEIYKKLENKTADEVIEMAKAYKK